MRFISLLFISVTALADLPVHIPMGNSVAVTQQGYLLVSGLDRWVTHLVPKSILKEGDNLVLLQDSKTGSVYAIKRVK